MNTIGAFLIALSIMDLLILGIISIAIAEKWWQPIIVYGVGFILLFTGVHLYATV